MKRCGGEKKSSNGCVACQRRSHPAPTPNARTSNATASQSKRYAAIALDRAAVATGGAVAVMLNVRLEASAAYGSWAALQSGPFRRSATVAQRTVNPLVGGSNPP